MEALKKSLKKHNWNKGKVVEELDTTYPSLAKIIKKYNLEN